MDKNSKIIEKFVEIHGDKYDYSLVNYEHSRKKVKIICPTHGVFEQRIYEHSIGQNCYKCSNINIGNKVRTSKENFISKAMIKHGNKYDYSLVEFKKVKDFIKIICPIHGVFEQTATSHLSGCGCKSCFFDEKSKSMKLDTDSIIDKFKSIHEKKYDYSLVNYLNTKTKVKIICPTHGVFEQTPNVHLNGSGCPICRESQGEKLITKILKSFKVDYKKWHTFEGCKNINNLIFDFYLPHHNTCLEYDGIQHYKPIKFFGGEDGLNKIKKRDGIKTDFCEKNKIELIRIKFDDPEILIINKIMNTVKKMENN